MSHTCRIALTPGEPAGIGPDLCIALAQRDQAAELVALADPELLAARAAQLDLPLTLETVNTNAVAEPSKAGRLKVVPISLATPAQSGHLDPGNAGYVLETLNQAIDGCVAGSFQALVTGPVHKGAINDAGIPFTGHTEYLAQRTQVEQVVMMLAAPGLRVALATTHLPLREVADAINQAGLQRVIEVLHRDLQQRFAIAAPRILVCGLNPHAGEGGHLGREEIEVIGPVLEQLRNQGMNLRGPLPADTLFTPPYLEQADAVLAMYHDQGLPVLKHMGFGAAVNITLGLPIIRTSVDHGTALELAGTGKALTGSLQAALDMALQLAGSGP